LSKEKFHEALILFKFQEIANTYLADCLYEVFLPRNTNGKLSEFELIKYIDVIHSSNDAKILCILSLTKILIRL